MIFFLPSLALLYHVYKIHATQAALCTSHRNDCKFSSAHAVHSPRKWAKKTECTQQLALCEDTQIANASIVSPHTRALRKCLDQNRYRRRFYCRNKLAIEWLGHLVITRASTNSQEGRFSGVKWVANVRPQCPAKPKRRNSNKIRRRYLHKNAIQIFQKQLSYSNVNYDRIVTCIMAKRDQKSQCFRL